jgi:hypothetical protein
MSGAAHPSPSVRERLGVRASTPLSPLTKGGEGRGEGGSPAFTRSSASTNGNALPSRIGISLP